MSHQLLFVITAFHKWIMPEAELSTAQNNTGSTEEINQNSNTCCCRWLCGESGQADPCFRNSLWIIQGLVLPRWEELSSSDSIWDRIVALATLLQLLRLKVQILLSKCIFPHKQAQCELIHKQFIFFFNCRNKCANGRPSVWMWFRSFLPAASQRDACSSCFPFVECRRGWSPVF